MYIIEPRSSFTALYGRMVTACTLSMLAPTKMTKVIGFHSHHLRAGNLFLVVPMIFTKDDVLNIRIILKITSGSQEITG